MEYHLDLETSQGEALAALGRAAEAWEAVWEPGVAGGRLMLPATAGLRQGVLIGRVDARTTGAVVRLTVTVESSTWRLRRPAVALLALGAVGALPVLLWPLDQGLLALAPAGLVMMFLAWFVVASRLRTAGAEEFLETVGRLLAERRPSG